MRNQIIAWGALAGALAAIVNLWPSIRDLLPGPDLVDRATFTSVVAVAPVRLSDHKSRLGGSDQDARSDGGVPSRTIVGDVGQHPRIAYEVTLVAQTESAVDGSSGDGGAGPEAPAAPDGVSEPAAAAPSEPEGGTPTEPAGGAPPEPGPPSEDGSAGPTQPADASPGSSPVESVEIAPFSNTLEIRTLTAEVLERQRLNDLCSSADCLPELTTTMQAITAQIAVDPEGNDVPPEEVADRVIDFFEQVRSIATEIPADGAEGSVVMEPVGVTVIADLEIEGLRGRELRLFWSMLRVNGDDTPLFSRWLGDTPVYRLLPKSDRVTTSVRFWVPLPQGPGTYLVSLTLTADGTPLARSVSNHVE